MTATHPRQIVNSTMAEVLGLPSEVLEQNARTMCWARTSAHFLGLSPPYLREEECDEAQLERIEEG